MRNVNKTPAEIAYETRFHVKIVREGLQLRDEKSTLQTRVRIGRPRVTVSQDAERSMEAIEHRLAMSAAELTQQFHLECSPETVTATE